MSSSQKLLKWNWVSVDPGDSRVIDNNELLEKRLSKTREMTPINLADMARGKGMSAGVGEAADSADFDGQRSYDDGVGGGNFSGSDDFSPGEFRSGLDIADLGPILDDPDDSSTLIKAPRPMDPYYDGPSPQELIEKARAEIDEMYAAAREDIEAQRQAAFEEGRSQGYQQGYNEGMSGAAAEIEQKTRDLEEEYRQSIRDLEPEFVKHLSGIYEHIINVKLSDYQNLVINLLESCLQKTEGSGSYIVHVSVDDYPFVSMQKKSLIEAIGSRNATFDVIEDSSLRKNECMIETDGGIYDCSLDSQLQALKRELLTISYKGED